MPLIYPDIVVGIVWGIQFLTIYPLFNETSGVAALLAMVMLTSFLILCRAFPKVVRPLFQSPIAYAGYGILLNALLLASLLLAIVSRYTTFPISLLLQFFQMNFCDLLFFVRESKIGYRLIVGGLVVAVGLWS